MFAIRQPSVEALRGAPVYFRYGSNKRRVLVDGLTARAKDASSLQYLAAWCFKRVSF